MLCVSGFELYSRWVPLLGCSPVKYCQNLSPTRRTVWHGIFAGSNFAIFLAIRKNKFPQIKITGKIYSRENIL